MNENTNPNLNTTRNSTRSSKAMLIIDMPDSCGTCPLRSYSNLALQCTPLRKTKETDDVCPLRPMPEKKVVTVKRIEDIQSYSITEVADKISAKIILKTNEAFAFGWNACLDEIMGEQNESNISN